MLIMPGADSAQAEQRAESLRAGIHHLDVHHDGRALGAISASFGVADFPAHGDDWGAVLEQADQALYRSKQAGRDRVTVAGLVTDDQPAAG